jgi:phage-related protein
MGDSLQQIRRFPDKARKQTGAELFRIQCGLEAADWKPMASVGAGVREIRVRDEAEAFRVMYVTRFNNAVYVLHAFQKKSQKTEQRDLDLASTRLRQIRSK